MSPVALAGRLRACHFYNLITVMQKSIVVQYSNKFIHGFGKFLIVLLCSLLLSLLLYSIVMWRQYNTMPGINLSEYWTSSLQKSSGRHWEKYHNSLVKFFLNDIFFIKISVKGCITLCFIMIFFQILFIQGIQNWNPRPWYAYFIIYDVFIC